MWRSRVHGFRLLSKPLRGALASAFVGVFLVLAAIAGCGENYVPVYEKPCESDLDCDDGQFCNGVETCDVASAQCQPGTAPDVNDGIDCTFDTCDEFNDVALHLPSDDMCSDGLYCNGAESCDAAVGCVAGVPVDADDGIPCTLDSCNEDTDTVVHALDDAVCDDGLFCNGTETCSTGGCVAGVPVVVSDNVDCTLDTCDENQDMAISIPVDSNCDDMDICTIDRCQPGLGCVATPDPLGDPTCFACDTLIYNNGVYDLQNGLRPTSGFINNGIIDDFVLSPGASEFCELRLSMLRTDGSLNHRQLRVRIYDLGAGGIAALGDFATTQPFYDEVYRVIDGNLIITDTGNDAFGYSVFDYSAITTPMNLGAGSFGLLLSFPDEGAATAYWATAPVTGDTSSSYVWGTDVTTPTVNTATGNQNMAFIFLGQSGNPLPLAPTSDAEPDIEPDIEPDSQPDSQRQREATAAGNADPASASAALSVRAEQARRLAQQAAAE